MTERGSVLADIIQGFLRTPAEVFAVAHRHTMLALVNGGFGVALVPPSIRQLCPTGVVLRDIGIDPQELHADLHLRRRSRSSATLAGDALPRKPGH